MAVDAAGRAGHAGSVRGGLPYVRPYSGLGIAGNGLLGAGSAVERFSGRAEALVSIRLLRREPPGCHGNAKMDRSGAKPTPSKKQG
jgi:hypothetical protein